MTYFNMAALFHWPICRVKRTQTWLGQLYFDSTFGHRWVYELFGMFLVGALTLLEHHLLRLSFGRLPECCGLGHSFLHVAPNSSGEALHRAYMKRMAGCPSFAPALQAEAHCPHVLEHLATSTGQLLLPHSNESSIPLLNCSGEPG